MKYKWFAAGDQDRCIDYRCYLGNTMLNLKEYGWGKDDIIIMCGLCYRFDPISRTWDDGEEVFVKDALPRTEWKRDFQCELETWFDRWCT